MAKKSEQMPNEMLTNRKATHEFEMALDNMHAFSH